MGGEIRAEMVFPIPGKWTIETREGGEFILTNETDQPATAYLSLEQISDYSPTTKVGGF